MKKVAFIEKTCGFSSLEDKAEQLKKVGHLEAIIDDPITGERMKYYSMAALHDFDLCAEVVYRAGRIVSVRNVSEDILRQIKVQAPVYGGF